MAKYNDLDMKNWKDYSDIYTDSLWLIDKRDNSGAHDGHYHGNFVPQIPNQLFRRYTKKGDWVLDPFMGSGTTLIEAQRLGRNGIGVELLQDVADEALSRISLDENSTTTQKVFVGDSRNVSMESILKEAGTDKVQFILYHPPYWDIVKFSENENDLSNTDSLDSFLNAMGDVIDNTLPCLEKNRYCAIVIGDKYANSEIVPLGFRCMQLYLDRGLKLKAILIKNFEETRAKANQRGIWRYRALANDFYIFKHEYIMIFKKTKK